MIWHQNIRAKPGATVAARFSEFDQSGTNISIVQDGPAFTRARCHEINRQSLKGVFKSSKTFGRGTLEDHATKFMQRS
jgi:hypothetical protein